MATTNELIKGLAQIPIELALVPVIGKRAILKNWTNIKLSRDELLKFIQEKKPDGYTIVLGPVNHGIVAVDIDGYGCHSEYEKIFGYLPNDDKTTVKVTSGKPGRRCEFYRIPATYWESIESKEIHTGIFDSDGKEENLELRWAGKMQNLPPSTHPDTGKTYQYISSFEESIIAEAPLALIERMLKPLSVARPEQSRPLTIVPSNYHTISIEQIISKECRDLLGGVAEGGRNNIGAKLSRALIGAEESAKRLGINLCDTAEQLFYDFCSRCTPAIPQKEADNIWKNALKDNPTSTLSDDYILNCVTKNKASRLDNVTPLYPNNKTTNQFTEVIGVQGVIAGKVVNLTIDNDTIKDKLLELSYLGLKESELYGELQAIASQNRRSIVEVQRFYEKIVADDRDLDSDRQEIDELLKASNRRLNNAKKFLPGPLKYIENRCNDLGFDIEVGILLLYTTVASLLKPETNLFALTRTKYRIYPTIYAVLVGESGQGKTPIIDSIINNPLWEMQSEIDSKYKIAIAEWSELPEEIRNKTPQPIARTLYLDGLGTIAGLRDLCSLNEGRGILRVMDELSGFFTSIIKGHSSDDSSKHLTIEGGRFPKDALASRENKLAGPKGRVNLPLIGGIQPEIFEQLIKAKDAKGNDADGGLARFMLVEQEPRYAPILDDEPYQIDIDEYLIDLYKKVDSLTITEFTFSPEAKALFINFKECCNKQVLESASVSFALKNQWRKADKKLGKMAMLIHIIHHLVSENNSTEFGIISEYEFKLARNWINYQLAQVKFFYSKLEQDNLNPIFVKILKKATSEGITPAKLQQSIRELKTVGADMIKSHLVRLAEMGYGTVQQDGRTFTFFKNQSKQENNI